MKRIPFLALALILSSAINAAPKIKGTNNGLWGIASTWDLGRIPVAGDTVIIPLNDTVIVDNPQTLGNIYVRVYGMLKFTHGKLTLGDNSIVMVYLGGKITGSSNSEKIRIGSQEVFRGNDPPVVGPRMADNTSGAGFVSFTLPVKFAGFTVIRKNSEVLVEWATLEELNADRFEVERSVDGATWRTVSSVRAAGTTSSVTHYRHTDYTNLTKTVFYRIKQVDIDGTYAFTPIRSLTGDIKASSVNVVVVNGKLVLQFGQEIKAAVDIKIVTAAGQVVYKRTVNRPSGQLIMEAGGLKGLFIVTITSPNELSQATKIVL